MADALRFLAADAIEKARRRRPSAGTAVADDAYFVGVNRFGFSGPGPQIYGELGLTPARIAQRVMDNL